MDTRIVDKELFEDNNILDNFGSSKNKEKTKYDIRQYDNYFTSLIPQCMYLTPQNFKNYKSTQYRFIRQLKDVNKYNRLYKCNQKISVCEILDISDTKVIEWVKTYKDCKQTKICPLCNLTNKYERYKELFYTLYFLELANKYKNEFKNFPLINHIPDESISTISFQIKLTVDNIESLNQKSKTIQKTFHNFKKLKKLNSRLFGYYWDIDFINKHNGKIWEIKFNALLLLKDTDEVTRKELKIIIETYFNKHNLDKKNKMYVFIESTRYIETDEVIKLFTKESSIFNPLKFNSPFDVQLYSESIKGLKLFSYSSNVVTLREYLAQKHFDLNLIFTKYIHFVNEDNIPSACHAELDASKKLLNTSSKNHLSILRHRGYHYYVNFDYSNDYKIPL